MRIKGIIPIGAALMCVASLRAQVEFNGDYSQDFDVLGTGSTLPDGWSAVRAAGSGAVGETLTPGITAGTATGGNVYNVGATGDSDRALGTLASSSTVPAFGLQLRNATGTTLDQLEVSGTMEQWRTGASDAVSESVVFEYSLNASGIDDGAAMWMAWPALDLNEKLVFSTSAGAVDGNSSDNQWGLGGSLTGLGWEDQGLLTLRWTDGDVSGSDGLYALDNLRLRGGISQVPEPSTYATIALGLGALGATRWRRSQAKPSQA